MIKKCIINFNEMKPVELFDKIVEDSNNLVVGDYPKLSISTGAISVKPIKDFDVDRNYYLNGDVGIIKQAFIKAGKLTLWAPIPNNNSEYIMELETAEGKHLYYQMEKNQYISVETE